MQATASRNDSIEPSATLSISAKASELQDDGIDVVNFGAGEPDFPTPEPIKQAGIDAINNDFTHYTAASGHPDLKQAVVDKFARDQDLDYSREQISTGCGAKHILFNIMASILNDGDEVIVPSPYWVSYPNQIRYFGGSMTNVNTLDTDFIPQPDRIRDSINANTKAVLLNSPSNPTGAVASPDILREIGQICVENDLYLISDEIYEKLIYGGEHTSPAELDDAIKQQTILVNGVSKAYSMTGWRIGYAAGPEDVIQPMNTLMSHSTSNPTSISQKAAIRALNYPDEKISDMVQTFRERRELAVDRLRGIDGIKCQKPGGAFYVFPDVSDVIDQHSTVDSDMQLAETLIEDAHIAVVPGSPFGAPGHLRMSYANATDRIRLGVDRLEDWIKDA